MADTVSLTIGGAKVQNTDFRSDIDYSLNGMEMWSSIMSKQTALDQTNNPRKFSIANPEQLENARISAAKGIFQRNSPKDSPDDPTPLINDKIASLPPGSRRRNELINLQFARNGLDLKHFSLDSVSPDLYKELQSLIHSSSYLSSIAEGKSSRDSAIALVGSNDVPFSKRFQEAAKPISSAIGSTADIPAAIKKSQFGTESSLPQAAIAQLDKITPNIANRHQVSKMSLALEKVKSIPSKICGSLRQLMAFLDKLLRIPFDILSDIYAGLMRLVDAISDLISWAVNKVVEWIMGLLGGLLDAIIPDFMTSGFFDQVAEFADAIGGLADMFGGFGAIGTIAHQISGIASAFGDPSLTKFQKIQALLSGIGNIIGAIGAMSYVPPGCINTFGIKMAKLANKFRYAGTLVGLLGQPSNIQFRIDIPLPKGLAKLVNAMRQPGGLLLAILPANISNAITRFMEMCCGAGYTGDGGFSGGGYFDDVLDHFYDKALSMFPVHNSIISPNFNKQSVPIGDYSRTASLGFADSSFVNGGVNFIHGLTNLGAGSTKEYKVIKTASAEQISKATSKQPTKVTSSKGDVITPW